MQINADKNDAIGDAVISAECGMTQMESTVHQRGNFGANA